MQNHPGGIYKSVEVIYTKINIEICYCPKTEFWQYSTLKRINLNEISLNVTKQNIKRKISLICIISSVKPVNDCDEK